MIDIFIAAIRNVKKELVPITKEWDDLGEALGLPHFLIRTIETDYPTDVLHGFRIKGIHHLGKVSVKL